MTNEDKQNVLAALVLAAGKSERMGKPKANLPWGKSTILGSIVDLLSEGGIQRIFIVFNPSREPIHFDMPENVFVEWVPNEYAETSEMLKSIQVGLNAIPGDVSKVLICLGDQPTIKQEVIKKLADFAVISGEGILFPSYRFRRGHPWVVSRNYWKEICSLNDTETVRIFINAHEKEICYLNFDFEQPEDVDTPETYLQLKNQLGM